MIPADTLAQILQRHEYLEAAMSEAGADIATLSKEYSDLGPVVAQINAYQQLLQNLSDAEEMMSDPEMRELAEMELPDLRAAVPDAERGHLPHT